MQRSLFRLAATVTLGLGMFAAPALAGNCSNGNKYVATFSSGGTNYEVKATCKGSWTIAPGFSAGIPGYVYVSTAEDGSTRACQGIMQTAGAGIGDVKKHKVECSYDTKGHSVKMELKQK